MRLNSDQTKHLVRIAAFIVCVVIGFRLILSAMTGAGGVLTVLAAMCFFVIGSVILAPLVAGFLSGWVGGLFNPTERGKPMPMYSVPESKYKREKFAEALQEFEKLSQQFPEEFRPYQAMLEITLIHLKDRARAEAIFQRGMRSLKQEEQRELLTKIYQAILAREQR
jgi:hypothetical protein